MTPRLPGRPAFPRAATAVGSLLVAALLAVAPAPTAAQVSAADSAAVLLETAREFETRERWDVAEPLYRLIVERFASTPAAALARDRLAAPPAAVAYGSGRLETQVWMSLYGAWLGVAVPAAFGADEPEAYGAGLLIGGPAGFFGGRALANALDLTEGQARAITLGGTWGTWQGWGWRQVFEIGTGQVCEPDDYCYEPEDATEEQFTAMVLGGLAGLAGGIALSGRDITPGTATAVSFGPLWGTWFGLAGGVIAGLEDDDLLAATLIAGNAGLLGAALLAPGWNASRSRVWLVSIGGIVGGLAGGGLDLIFQPDDEKVAVALPLAGSVLGLVLGAIATREDDGSRLGSLGDGGGALLDFRDGRLALGSPVPLPTLRPATGGRAAAWEPAIALEIFRARF